MNPPSKTNSLHLSSSQTGNGERKSLFKNVLKAFWGISFNDWLLKSVSFSNNFANKTILFSSLGLSMIIIYYFIALALFSEYEFI